MSLYNVNSGYGGIIANQLANAVGPTLGRIFIVQEDSDPDEIKTLVRETFQPDSEGRIRYFTDLATAYGAVTSNANDCILMSAHSTHSLTAGIAWEKNRVNVIGMDGGDRMLQQGCKVQLATAATTAYVLKNTGVRNSFRNIKFIQAATAATGLYVAQMGGEGNLYKNCSFTFGVADNLDLTTASEVILGEDSGTFINCEFGQYTLTSSASARTIMTIDQVTTSQECKDNVFVDCVWKGASSDADLQCISMSATTDLLYPTHLIRPSFLASISTGAGTIQCTKAVSTANGTANGMILISYPVVHGFADIGINGTNNDNLYVFSHVPSATDITSIQPTTT